MDKFTYFMEDGCPKVYDYINLYMTDEEIEIFKRKNKKLLDTYDKVYESCELDYNFSKELNNLNRELKSEINEVQTFDNATTEQRIDFKNFEKNNIGKIFAVSTKNFKPFLDNKEDLGNYYTLIKYLGRGKAKEYYTGKIIYINSPELRRFINSLEDSILISYNSTESVISKEIPLDKVKKIYDIYENNNELYPVYCDYSDVKNVDDITSEEKRNLIFDLSDNVGKEKTTEEKLNTHLQRIIIYFLEEIRNDIYNKEIAMYEEAYVENMIYNMKNDLGNRPITLNLENKEEKK